MKKASIKKGASTSLGLKPTTASNLPSPDSSATLPGKSIPRKWQSNYDQLMRLREDLLQQSKHLTELAVEEKPTCSLHPGDAGTDAFDRDLAFSLLSSEQNALQEIDEAIQRIENGTYGRCEVTGKPISKARLQAIPWTRFTVATARQLESESALPRTRFASRGTLTVVEEKGEDEDETE